MADVTKILLDESEMPTQWYNIIPDLPSPPPPPLHPGTHEPVGPDDLAPLFPMDLILQEVSTDSLRRHPRRGAGRLPAVAAVAAVPGPPAGEAPRYPGTDLLQVRRCQPGRFAQAEHRGAPGVLQRDEGREEAHDRDRGRSVGHGTRVRLRAVRHRVRGLAGAAQLRLRSRTARR